MQERQQNSSVCGVVCGAHSSQSGGRLGRNVLSPVLNLGNKQEVSGRALLVLLLL